MTEPVRHGGRLVVSDDTQMTLFTLEGYLPAGAMAAALAPGASVPGLGEGWVGEEALAIGLHAALVSDGYEDAVRLASNHDGDSDSTASIAGQLVGAWKGAGVVPAAWVEGLDCRVELTKLARELA